MKKLILILLVLPTSILLAQQGPSPEYSFMRDTYDHTYRHQKLIEFLGLMSNNFMNVVKASCGNVPAGQDCSVSSAVSVTVTQDMADASEIFFGQNEGFDEGEVIVLSEGALTFRRLSNSLFKYAISIDTSKIAGEDMKETFTFSWNNAGDISRVYYGKNGTIYNSCFVLLKRNGENKIISNAIFDDRANGGDAGTYIMEVRLTDPAQNGIIERLSFYDIKNDKEVLSKGIIDDNGGSVYIDPFGNKTFDANGNDKTWANPTIAPDNNNGALLEKDGSGTYLNYKRFAIVKQGETVGKYTVLGYIFESYDADTYEYEYFGETALLASKGVTNDTDSLDIYALNNDNVATVKVTGLWLTKQ